MDMHPSKKILSVLLITYVLLFVVLAVHPVDRTTWLIENLTVLLIVGNILLLYVRNIRFSVPAYLLMSVLVYLHTIGGHYTLPMFGSVTAARNSSCSTAR